MQQVTVSIPDSQGETASALSAQVAHWLSAGELPSELLTGHPLIDREHRFLIDAMANLRKVCIDMTRFTDCTACSLSQQSRCEKNVISLLGDIFSFILEHFRHEEQIMRNSMLQVVDYAVCRAHIEDHAEIATKVQQIVAALDSSQTLFRIRELDTLLERWVTNHITLHDMLLSRWVADYEPQLNAPA